MYEDYILKARESAPVLLKGQQALLRQINDTRGLVHEASKGQERVLDKQRLAGTESLVVDPRTATAYVLTKTDQSPGEIFRVELGTSPGTNC